MTVDDADNLEFVIEEDFEEHDRQVIPATHTSNAHTQNGSNQVTSSSLANNQHALQQMAIVRSRIGFDEAAFRARFQAVHSEATTELKRIVDGIYDALDRGVSDLSRSIAVEHAECLREMETALADIRATCTEAAVTDQNMQAFVAYMQQAFNAVWRSNGS